jgi:SAM-dependent methyltransferase
MPHAEVPDFPDNWYDITTEDHFWTRWRFRVFLKQLQAFDVPTDHPLHGLDIGCGHGVVQRQIEAATTWQVDGCEQNPAALERHAATRGNSRLYDIQERREDMRDAFDFLVLFDVIEHIEKPQPFLDAALFHLKPEGLIFVNVPALGWLHSRYDRVAGHFRRYSTVSLRAELEEGGAEIMSIGYWGLTMVPLLFLRKALFTYSKKSDADVIRTGFHPPAPVVGKILTGLSLLETELFRFTPLGSSVFAMARKPAANRR